MFKIHECCDGKAYEYTGVRTVTPLTVVLSAREYTTNDQPYDSLLSRLVFGIVVVDKNCYLLIIYIYIVTRTVSNCLEQPRGSSTRPPR